jgi:hypothetical protein
MVKQELSKIAIILVAIMVAIIVAVIIAVIKRKFLLKPIIFTFY